MVIILIRQMRNQHLLNEYRYLQAISALDDLFCLHAEAETIITVLMIVSIFGDITTDFESKWITIGIEEAAFNLNRV